MIKIPQQVLEIKKKLDIDIEKFKARVHLLEERGNCDIYYFPYLTIIKYNQEQYIFDSKESGLHS